MQINVNTESEFLAAVIQGKSEITSDLLFYIEPGHFSLESYQWILKKLKEREWKPIQADFVDQLLDDDLQDEEKKNLFRMQIYNLYHKNLTFIDDAVKKFKTFIAHSVIKATTKSAFESFDRSGRIDYMIKELSEANQKASVVVTDGDIKIVDYADTYREREDRRILERNNPAINPVIKTGIKGLDMQFEIKSPMVVEFLAPFKRYKSIILNSTGFSSLLQGFNVLHVVYENTIELTSDRYDALFSGIGYDRILSMALTQDEKQRMNALFNWVKSWNSRLKILKCAPKKTTIPEIAEQIQRLYLKEGFKPDVIIIDYLNIVAASQFEREERLEQGRVVWDMKALADTYKVPIITASQTNMEGTKVERIKMEHRGKSIDISQGINLSIAINQTKEEKEEGLLVFSPLFSRESEITIPDVVVDCDLNRMAISRDFGDLWHIASQNFPYIPQ